MLLPGRHHCIVTGKLRVIESRETGSWPGGPTEISRWRKAPDPTTNEQSPRQWRDLPEVDRFLDYVAARANRHAIFYLMLPHLSDPDDEFILKLALARGSALHSDSQPG